MNNRSLKYEHFPKIHPFETKLEKEDLINGVQFKIMTKKEFTD
jgi:hypothetical protein